VATKNRGKIDVWEDRGKAWLNGDLVAHYNESTQLHSSTSTTPQSTSVWLGMGGINQAIEKRLRFVVCIFWNFCRQEDFKVCLNCNWADKLDHSSQSLTLQIQKSMNVRWGGGSNGKGKVPRLYF
jgi:hypothetical protein